MNTHPNFYNISLLEDRGLVLPKNPCVHCRQPLLELRCLHMCLLQPMTMRCLGNQLLMYLHMMYLGQPHNRFCQLLLRHSIFLCQLLMLRYRVLILLLQLLQELQVI
jgi:hypothetical protein